jgi:hypothetical protein
MEDVKRKEKLKKLATLLITDFFISNPGKVEKLNAIFVNNGVNVSNDFKKIMLKHFICVDLEDEIVDFMNYDYTCFNFLTILNNLLNEGTDRYTYDYLKSTNYLHFINEADFNLIERAFFKDVAA